MRLSNSITLPNETASRTLGIIAQKGAGKTYTAMLLTEQMLAAGTQVVCLDPTGVWWGLRSSADGKSPGLPILVMGGDHGDVPLDSHAGEIVARFVVESGQSVVLDLSAFESNAAQDRFATAFAETVYRLKAATRSPLHLMIDEADSFAPQRPMPGQQRMLGAFEAIVRRGRSRGLGLTMISQRPAVLNKNVLSQVDVLLCGRLVGQHDHKALSDWTGLYGTPEQRSEFMKSVPGLPVGTMWVWSPGWLQIFERAAINRRTTYDSSSTPAHVAKVAPVKVATVDLAKLSAEIAASAKSAAENDPKRLKAEVARLTKELAAKPAAAPPEKITVEVPALTSDQTAVLAKLSAALEAVSDIFNLDNPRDILRALQKRIVAPTIPPMAQFRGLLSRPEKPTAFRRSVSDTKPAAAPTGDISINTAQQRILDALAWFESIGTHHPSNIQIGALALIDSTGGHYSNLVGPLSTNGLVIRANGTMSLTDEGRRYARVPDQIATLADYHEMMRQRVRRAKSASNKTVAMLDAIISRGNGPVSAADIGAQVGIDHTGGHFSNTIGPLSTIGLIERSSGMIRPTEILFPPAIT